MIYFTWFWNIFITFAYLRSQNLLCASWKAKIYHNDGNDHYYDYYFEFVANRYWNITYQ